MSGGAAVQPHAIDGMTEIQGQAQHYRVTGTALECSAMSCSRK